LLHFLLLTVNFFMGHNLAPLPSGVQSLPVSFLALLSSTSGLLSCFWILWWFYYTNIYSLLAYVMFCAQLNFFMGHNLAPLPAVVQSLPVSFLALLSSSSGLLSCFWTLWWIYYINISSLLIYVMFCAQFISWKP
jgi:hypothetical protein